MYCPDILTSRGKIYQELLSPWATPPRNNRECSVSKEVGLFAAIVLFESALRHLDRCTE